MAPEASEVGPGAPEVRPPLEPGKAAPMRPVRLACAHLREPGRPGPLPPLGAPLPGTLPPPEPRPPSGPPGPLMGFRG